MSWRAFDGKSIANQRNTTEMWGKNGEEENAGEQKPTSNWRNGNGNGPKNLFLSIFRINIFTDWKMDKNLFDGGFWCQFESESLNIQQKWTTNIDECLQQNCH